MNAELYLGALNFNELRRIAPIAAVLLTKFKKDEIIKTFKC